MARTLLPYFNASTYGEGIEGATNYTNSVTGNFMVPAFLLVMYGLAIYVFSKSGYKLGAGIAFISLVFFIIAIVAQTFVTFNQIIIFIFFIGILVGVVLHFIESAKT